MLASLALLTARAAFVAPQWSRTAASGASSSLLLSRSGLDKRFDGIGGLSGGGATTRLLVDYPEKQQQQILDYLFTPNFGASLQILKVEIGGDAPSTDGTEPSHMHSKDDLDLTRGYEWWLMKEAKKRNPDIKLYGLPWAYPGWVGTDPQTGKPSGSPFTYPNQTSDYIMQWIKGARTEYGLEIDYIGIWNERSSDAKYAAALRQTLDNAGFSHTQIVAKDGGADICDAMKKDPEYAKTVDIIGLHYPSDYSNYDTCHSLGKPVWASEESSSYDDLNGAACWARVINSHYVLSGMTSSIMWNLVGAYYHGTNWYASSMLTSVQPWSGHYDTFPVVWATAHVTQFTKVGWRYLKNGSGSGKLPKGGFYTTIADGNGTDFTLQVVKIDHDHAPCTRPSLPSFDVSAETVTFSLDASMKAPAKLAVWKSNLESEPAVLFEQQPDVDVSSGSFSLNVAVGDFYTVSTVRTATKGSHGQPPKSVPQFPLPHVDDFDAVVESQEARYFADQIGAFEVHKDAKNASNKVMRQMVPQAPIGWVPDFAYAGPVTVLGMREWRDVTVAVDFRVPEAGVYGCVGARSDQMWTNGVFLCIGTDGVWNVTYGGPGRFGGVFPQWKVHHGRAASPMPAGEWHRLSLTVVGGEASGAVGGEVLFSQRKIRSLDSGFAVMGTNGWHQVEYDNVAIRQAGPHWAPAPPPGCGAAKEGTTVSVRACQPNGLSTDDQVFDLLPSWELRHGPSGLCVTAASMKSGAGLTLQKCIGSAEQQFRNDYTHIRNKRVAVKVGDHRLAGQHSGRVELKYGLLVIGWWTEWSYFPNTRQLRNQYVADPLLGDPMCLSACS